MVYIVLKVLQGIVEQQIALLLLLMNFFIGLNFTVLLRLFSGLWATSVHSLHGDTGSNYSAVSYSH